MHKLRYGPVFSFLLGRDLGVELLGHMGTLCVTWEELLKLFIQTAHFTFPSAIYKGSNFSPSSPASVIVFLIITILLRVEWYFNVVVICSSLMTRDAVHLLTCLLALRILLLENSGPLTPCFCCCCCCY